MTGASGPRSSPRLGLFYIVHEARAADSGLLEHSSSHVFIEAGLCLSKAHLHAVELALAWLNLGPAGFRLCYASASTQSSVVAVLVKLAACLHVDTQF